jgi:nicotinamidase-related amidase
MVIDVQNEYFTGALPITHPAKHLERILKVMDAEADRIPTVVVQHHAEGRPIFRKGSRG